MKRSPAMIIATSLLAGCQGGLPFFGGVPEGGWRMQPRTEAIQPMAIQPVAGAQAQALASLTEAGYHEAGMPLTMAKATFKLEVADFEEGAEAKLKDVVFADYMTAISHAQQAGFDNVLPSVNLVDGVTKHVNDGLYARLELIHEADTKAALRRRLYEAFKKAWEAHPEDAEWQKLAARTAASLELAGETPAVPGALQGAFDQALKDFEADALLSKPIGFFTMSDPLRRIFRSDRMLQSRVALKEDGVPQDAAIRQAALAASVMAEDTALAQDYDAMTRFYARMTNPFMAYAPTALVPIKPEATTWAQLAAASDQRSAFFDRIEQDAEKRPGMFLEFSLLPPSRSVETALFASDPPPGGDLMGHLIRRVREGKVSLAPEADSGFYQYQQHALEALLKPDQNPEGTKIAFGEKYMQRLEEAFKTGLAKARETHAKQIGWGPVPTSAPPPPLKPRFFVEPIITVYQRYGAMYDFLEREVLPLFPEERLASASLLTEAGEGGQLVAEVAAAKRLMYGLYLVGAASLGLAPDPALPLDEAGRRQALEEAKAWLADHRSSPAMAADTRVAVPVGVSEPQPGQKFIHFWGTGGVTLVKIQAEYVTPPEGAYGEPEAASYFVAADKLIAFKRPYEKGVLDRGEYRQILDGSTSWGEALRKLEQ